MNTFLIICAGVAGALALRVFAEVAFWVFAQAFGIIDRYIQN